jgi:lipopolysaccharide/colanic/teichoic acid biosynthesis glycosyltransferase
MNKILIRFFDFVFALLGLIIFFPFFVIITIFILLDNRDGLIYKQSRVGKDNKDFLLWKFKTMKTGADKTGLITVGKKDSRITRVGYYLRSSKLDELPQLVNVLKGEMSLVGPRPEVRKYVDLYSSFEKKVLSVKPGITDFASIEYLNESELLARTADPDKTYVEEIMPAKIKLNMRFIEEQTVGNYFHIILKTIGKIFSTPGSAPRTPDS